MGIFPKPRQGKALGSIPNAYHAYHTTNVGYFSGKKAGAADNKHNEKSDNLARRKHGES